MTKLTPQRVCKECNTKEKYSIFWDKYICKTYACWLKPDYTKEDGTHHFYWGKKNRHATKDVEWK